MLSGPVEREQELPSVESAPAFRLRYLLAFALLAALASWVYPRGRAAWQLHNLSVVYADYGLCMVGPTGADLMKNDPASFIELARRRIVTSRPEARPFARCEPFAEKLGVDHTAYRLHQAAAESFAEYHNGPGDDAWASVNQLDLSLERLAALAEEAWPFVRHKGDELMKPSSHAKEAPHPPIVPIAGRGSGLPASRHIYRSTAAFGDTVVASLGSGANTRTYLSKNGGIDWVVGGRRLASDLQDRCMADDEGRAFTLSRTNDGKRIVLSQGPGAAPQIAVLSGPELKIAGLSCDESALVAALVHEPDETGRRPASLRICPFRRPCRALDTPPMGKTKLYYPLDIARIGGDIVISRTSGGVTRVASSRDQGRSWTPWTVAFDSVTSGAGPAPFRLLTAADSLLLYSGGAGAYPLLVSADHGASFQAPQGTPSVEPTSDRFAEAQ